MEPIKPMDLPIEALDSIPRVRRVALHEPAGERLDRRLRDYLVTLGLPEALIADWIRRARQGEADAGLVFERLRALMAEYWQSRAEVPPRGGEAAAVAQFRLCRWLTAEAAGEATDCPLRIDALFDLPDIWRRSMLPEQWSD
ncbi:hypothetical protein BI364_13900 [Acidihalobacter yilgarnensis]|uniref:Uncharacterized protein n=1 Tax=Acidihalobacter yilgarnensis TaxID=2819280 RepID=A0A1D8IR90_9GAMM|nr:hypothetical protein [Acidihalobacter yilgarnensis]AOU98903.1 hypothetical protein BI364_13900 [Acidihalobacter yilgarnensis]